MTQKELEEQIKKLKERIKKLKENIKNLTSTIPQDFDVREAEATLQGEADALIGMCYWPDTYQGYEFWSREYNQMKQGDHLSPEAQESITNWIKLCTEPK